MSDSIDTPENPIDLKTNILKFEAKELSELERNDFGDPSLETVKLDLQRYLRKLHHGLGVDLLEKVSHIEEECIEVIHETLEKSLGTHLEKHFEKVARIAQVHIAQMTSPLLKRAEEDLNRLNKQVNTITTLCQNIREQYSFRWEKPFLTLIAAISLTGAFIVLGFLAMQASSVAVFFMNEKSRDAYTLGLRILDNREKWQTRQQEKKALNESKKKKNNSHKNS